MSKIKSKKPIQKPFFKKDMKNVKCTPLKGINTYFDEKDFIKIKYLFDGDKQSIFGGKNFGLMAKGEDGSDYLVKYANVAEVMASKLFNALNPELFTNTVKLITPEDSLIVEKKLKIPTSIEINKLELEDRFIAQLNIEDVKSAKINICSDKFNQVGTINFGEGVLIASKIIEFSNLVDICKRHLNPNSFIKKIASETDEEFCYLKNPINSEKMFVYQFLISGFGDLNVYNLGYKFTEKGYEFFMVDYESAFNHANVLDKVMKNFFKNMGYSKDHIYEVIEKYEKYLIFENNKIIILEDFIPESDIEKVQNIIKFIKLEYELKNKIKTYNNAIGIFEDVISKNDIEKAKNIIQSIYYPSCNKLVFGEYKNCDINILAREFISLHDTVINKKDALEELFNTKYISDMISTNPNIIFFHAYEDVEHYSNLVAKIAEIFISAHEDPLSIYVNEDL